MTENYEAVSLFSGAMGLDIGLKKAGIDVKITVENNPHCIKTIETNGHSCLSQDISLLTKQDPECNLIKSYLIGKEPFVVVGGPPCQPFSVAGKRKGLNDPRGTLFKDFVYIIN